MLNLITALLCFSGFFIGNFIAGKTKEEVRITKKYFLLSLKIIPIMIFLFVVIFEFDMVLLMLIAAILSLIVRNPYLFLGTSFLINDVNFILLNSSLVFIYCLFDGSFSKNHKGIFLKFLLFIIPILGGTLNALFNWNWFGQ